jgi:hypothetical protein
MHRVDVVRTVTFIVAVTVIAVQGLPASAQQPPSLPNVKQIDGDRVHTLLRPDAIPSIDDPQFVPAAEASFMRDDEPVVGMVRTGVAKAYSTWHLDHHEIVNDEVGGKFIAVTW